MEIPFDIQYQCYDMTAKQMNGDDLLPGQPRVQLAFPDQLFEYLRKDLETGELDAMSPNLWLVATHSSGNVSPLHHQAVKGRRIIITEDPRLHLLWIDDRIFVKPLPLYLMSYDFWEQYLLPDASSIASLNQKNQTATYPERNAQKKELTKAALGFLRTYLLLIQYQSDFDIALAHRLVPATATFDSFCLFTSRFETIKNDEVTPRYHYGELRLGRLNIWCKFLLRKWHYQTVHRQYGQYFARFYGPFLFAFGFFSVILSALQVEMAVENQYQSGNEPHSEWPHFWTFSRIFSMLSLAVIGFPSIIILLLLIGKPLMEMKYALAHRPKGIGNRWSRR